MDAIEIKRGDSFDYGVEIPSEFADGHFGCWAESSGQPQPHGHGAASLR